jgi:hypothetical protein
MDELPITRSGRYAGIAAASYTGADHRRVVYLTRRFVPQPENLVQVGEHRVQPGERLDHIAAHHFGDPELFWRLCDANRATDPALLATPGRRLRVTLPAELAWNAPAADDA